MALNFLNNGYFAGKVGIIEDNPTQTLHVGDGTIDAVIRSVYTDGSYTDIHGYGIFMSRVASYIKPVNDNSQSLYFGDVGTGANWLSITSNAATNVWKKDATEFMRLNSSGNLGIGTDSPNAKLEVNSAITFSTIDTFGQLVVKAASGSTGDMLNIGVDTANSVTFIQANDRGVGTIPLSLQRYGGNVGIGTPSPGAKLEIKDGDIWLNGATSSSNPEIRFLDDSPTIAGAKIRYGNSDGNLYIEHMWDTSTSGIFFRNRTTGTTLNTMALVNGNVGIGTTSPTSQLSIGSNAITTKKPTVIIADGVAGGSLVIRGLSPILSFDRTGASPENKILMDGAGLEFKTGTLDAEGDVDFKIKLDGKLQAPAYTQGFLQSDGSGNIEISGGGTLPGGPYLPLSAGSSYPLTGDLYMPGFIFHVGDTDSYFGFGAPNVFDLVTGGSRKLYADSNAVYLYKSGSQKLRTTTDGITVTGGVVIDSALLSNQENTDVDTGAEVVAQVSTSTYTAAFFDFVIKKVGNIRSGTVYACHDGTNVEFTETSTQDLGDTSDVTLSVDKSGTNLRLIATVTSDDWIIKSLIRAI
jgi:hypothetical protein